MKLRKFNILLLILSTLCLLASCNLGSNSSLSETTTESSTTIDYSYSDIERLDYLNLWGYKDLERYDNKNQLKLFYKDIYDEYNNFIRSTVDLAEEKIEVTTNGVKELKSYYVINRLDFRKYNLSSNQALAVWHLVGLDNPLFYFASSNILADSTKLVLTCLNECHLFSQRENINNKITEYIDSFNTYKETKDDLIRAIHDYIVNNTSYKYNESGLPDDSPSSHNILGIVLNNSAVCEGYTKIFQLLCHINNIECVLSTGTGKTKKGDENHAWNIIKIDDNWYFIDVTWDDSLNSLKYYLKSYSEMIKDHIPDISNSINDGINYIYNLPVISTTDYESVS